MERRITALKKILTLVFLIVGITAVKSQVVYVDPSATGNGNGASWTNAVTDLQAGIDLAATVATSANPIQVWVKSGTYKATTGTDPTIRFELKNYVEMYGGFAGSESLLTERDIQTNPTIISGDIGVLDELTDNSQGLLIVDALVDGPVILDGFVFDGAYDPSNISTIGIINPETGATPTEYVFRNSTFSNNNVTFGSVLGFTSIPARFFSCKFIDNFQVTLWSTGNLEVYNSLFEGNSFPIYIQTGTFVSVNNTYYNNTGIAVNLFDQPTPVVSFLFNNIFWQNSAEDIFAGGNASTNLTAVNNLVEDPFTFGTNTITGDPQFIDPANNDFRISHCSPAVDQGDNSQLSSITEDLSGNPRIFNTTVDLGAYENQISPVFYAAAEVGDVLCHDGSDGQISVNAGGGTGAPITYSLDGVSFSANSVFAGLSAGTYSVYATDGTCTYSEEFTVNEPSPITVEVSVSLGVTSNDLTVTASGGAGLYQYSIDGINFQSSGTFSVSAGQITISVRDASNCTITEIVTISPEGRLVLYLDPDASGSSSGTSWANAFIDLQTAIDQAGISASTNNEVELWVKEGTYYPTIQTSNDRTRTIIMRDNVHLMGGFLGTETAFSQRDVKSNLTILSGDIGVLGDSTDNSYGMLTVDSNISNEASIDGWQIEGAFSLAVEPTNGAIHMTGTAADFYVRNCTFRYNLSNEGACIRTTQVTNQTSKLFVESSAFYGNGFFTNTGYIGSAIYATRGAEVYNSIFVDNKSGNGGAFYLAGTSEVDIINCTFYDNSAGTGSVLVGLGGASLSLHNSILWNNPSTNNQQLTISGSTISNNIIEGFNSGNNINQDPEFVDLASMDLAIKHCSPGIDAGDDTFLPLGGDFDFGGSPRIFGNSVDIGAFESQNAPIAISLVSQIDVSCNGGNDGQIEVAASGGTGSNLEYSIDGVNFSTNASFGGLSSGSYTITVADPGNGCEVTEDYTIIEPNSIIISAMKTDVSCNGLAEGVISGTISEGTAPYQVYLDGTLMDTGITSNFTIDNLPAGSFTLSVIDDNGCNLVFPSTLEITEPTVLSATSTVTDVLCNGDATGMISMSAIGGTVPYDYSIDGTSFQTSNSFETLSAGNYTVIIRDANGCTNMLNEVVSEPTELTIQPDVVSDATCEGQSDGSISVSVGGGVGPYEYSLDGGAFTSSDEFTNLSAGNYTVTVRDANGCEEELTETVSNQFSVTATASSVDPLCNGDSSGEITLSVNGGTAPYEYFISGSSSPQSSPVFSGLVAGSYSLRSVDANGCQASVTVELTDPAQLTAQSTGVNVSCNGDMDGSIEVISTGGTSPYEYSLDGTTFQSSGSFSGLGAGTYTVTIIDANSCQQTESITITEPDELNATVIQVSRRSFTVTASGGTAPYEYTADGLNFQSSDSFTELAPGDYAFTVRDANGCLVTTEQFEAVLSVDIPEFTIYPNPTAGVLSIKGIEYDEASIFSLDGKVMQSTKAGEQIDLSALGQGQYILQLRAKGKIIGNEAIIKR